MSETALFPLPFDATQDDRERATQELAKFTKVLGEEGGAIKIAAEQIGQTGPVWHFQYTRLYRLPNGFLAAARDIHEGTKVAFAEKAEQLPGVFAKNDTVKEFLEDELRYRKIIGPEHGSK